MDNTTIYEVGSGAIRIKTDPDPCPAQRQQARPPPSCLIRDDMCTQQDQMRMSAERLLHRHAQH